MYILYPATPAIAPTSAAINTGNPDVLFSVGIISPDTVTASSDIAALSLDD